MSSTGSNLTPKFGAQTLMFRTYAFPAPQTYQTPHGANNSSKVIPELFLKDPVGGEF